MKEQPNYYAIIPENVRHDKNLTPLAKLLYGEIAALCNEKGYCCIGNEYFSNLYGVSKKTISRRISDLTKYGYAEVINNRDIVSDLVNKNMSGLGYGDCTCAWCKVKTSVLHKHHYPIPKSLGGVDTVDICPNCHHEFHYHQRSIKLLLPKAELKELLRVRSEKDESKLFSNK